MLRACRAKARYAVSSMRTGLAALASTTTSESARGERRNRSMIGRPVWVSGGTDAKIRWCRAKSSASTQPVNDASTIPTGRYPVRAAHARTFSARSSSRIISRSSDGSSTTLSGDRHSRAVVICDHPPGITIGREGSRACIRRGRKNSMRAGGRSAGSVAAADDALIRLPGQVMHCSILPLDTIGQSVTAYLGELQDLVVELLRDHELAGAPDPVHPGIQDQRPARGSSRRRRTRQHHLLRPGAQRRPGSRASPFATSAATARLSR